VRGFIGSVGWMLFLLLAVVFLLFYNLAYAPRADRIVRQQNEIAMWTGQVQELSDSLQLVKAQFDTVLRASFSFDELFGGADEFSITPQGESALRACVPAIQGLPGRIDVVGHGDRTGVPVRLRQQYPSNWEYAAARAGAVARALIAWGVLPERVYVLSAGDLRPPADSSGVVGATPRRRVEIIVRNR
jgi:chemotaxis protein MotB